MADVGEMHDVEVVDCNADDIDGSAAASAAVFVVSCMNTGDVKGASRSLGYEVWVRCG